MSERKTLSDARKGRKADIEACAKAKGMSVNGWICGYIREAAGMSEEEWKRSADEQGDA